MERECSPTLPRPSPSRRAAMERECLPWRFSDAVEDALTTDSASASPRRTSLRARSAATSRSAVAGLARAQATIARPGASAEKSEGSAGSSPIKFSTKAIHSVSEAGSGGARHWTKDSKAACAAGKRWGVERGAISSSAATSGVPRGKDDRAVLAQRARASSNASRHCASPLTTWPARDTSSNKPTMGGEWGVGSGEWDGVDSLSIAALSDGEGWGGVGGVGGVADQSKYGLRQACSTPARGQSSTGRANSAIRASTAGFSSKGKPATMRSGMPNSAAASSKNGR